MTQPYRINLGKQFFCTLVESSIGVIFIALIFLIISASINIESNSILIVASGWLGLMLGIIILGGLFQAITLYFISYELTPQTLIMRGGIIARYERNVPFSKIQHLVLSQTLMQRIFHLSTFSVQNADQGNIVQTHNILLANISLPGLSKSDAEALRKEIIGKVIKTKGSGIN